MNDRREPRISVGLIDGAQSIALSLHGYQHAGGDAIADGAHELKASAGHTLHVVPRSSESFFRIETTIGIDFHWQQRETQSFHGALRVERDGDRLIAVNDVPLETYLHSVICSEMNAASPPESLRAHSVISRSWLLAQIAPQPPRRGPAPGPGEHIKWYDRQAHGRFDVCADDHCQRYQGITRIANENAAEAVRATRGMVLLHRGKVADARYSKCCGAVVESYRTAWHDEDVPYLIPLFDGPDETLPREPLTGERAFRAFIESPPDAFCNCSDTKILDAILPSYDRKTFDFYRWNVRLGHQDATRLIKEKLGFDFGRITALEPVERATSGRLTKLRIRGENGSIVIGKELEIRRALSPSHLYSSAFLVETEGPADRPETFILRGAGWGHGVGLCQIGGAVMATRGYDHRQILAHYYPNTTLESLYD